MSSRIKYLDLIQSINSETKHDHLPIFMRTRLSLKIFLRSFPRDKTCPRANGDVIVSPFKFFEIGEYFGGIRPSAVNLESKRIKKRMKSDKRFSKKIRLLESNMIDSVKSDEYQILKLQPNLYAIIVANVGLQSKYLIVKRTIRNAIHNKQIFNIIHSEGIVKVDFIIRKDTNYRNLEFKNRRSIVFEGQKIFIASPEDLILSKLFWARESLSEMQIRDVKNSKKLKRAFGKGGFILLVDETKSGQ